MASCGGSGSGASGSGSGGSGGDAADTRRRINEEVRAYTSTEINRLIQEHLQRQLVVPHPIHRQAVVPRDHLAAHRRLYEDYFTPEPRFGDNFFRGCFRMHQPLFMSTVSSLEHRYEYLRIREDACGKPGHMPIQKCTDAIRLAYGGATDMFDEYLHIGETSARDCLKYFCEGVIEIFRIGIFGSLPPKTARLLWICTGISTGFRECWAG